MQPHQALELLLFYAFPRIDTNELAHNLIDRFGSLRGVFDAGMDELTEVKGIGENAAVLIKLIPQIYSMYATSACSGQFLRSPKEICQYFLAQYFGVTVEQARIVCLDDNMRIKYSGKLASGNSSRVIFDSFSVVEALAKSGCTQCILAHNHPFTRCVPSPDDLATTDKMYELLKSMGIKLIDHVIVGTDGARTLLSGDMNLMLNK